MEMHDVGQKGIGTIKTEFLTAFGKAWRQLLAERSKKEVLDAYGGATSWTGLLFGPKSSFELSESSSPFLFPLVARHLGVVNATPITQVRQQDYTIDMSFVGGEYCLGANRGWGYASRQLVLIEHENEAEKSEEEFYKLLFRVADIKVLAFPDWAKDRIGKGRNSPVERTLERFRKIAEQAGPHVHDEDMLALIAQRESESTLPDWTWVERPWVDRRQLI